jgi:DNA helicase-2/ATP-dependent DNA helicase PcrA
MLVVAGAGTGKTTVLASRVVRLIEDGLAKPSEILAVTYTRNSARDLLKRVAKLWKGSDDFETVSSVAENGLKIGTFHAYCFSLLRSAGQRFQLLEEQDLYALLRRRIDDLKLQYYVKAASPGRFLLGLNGFFKRCHDELRTPDDYDTYVRSLESQEIALPRVLSSKLAEDMSDDQILGRCHEIARVFRQVEKMLEAERLGTYSHVITRAVKLLANPADEEHLQRARQGARFVLIDEFQDSNVAQIELARLLAGEQANVFAVGDPDQAIYRFRGATAGTFDHFLRTFGIDTVKRVTMAENRRSTAPVLKAAFLLISQNPEITSVELPGGEKWKRVPLEHKRTLKEPSQVSPVLVRGWGTTDAEASFVAGEVQRLHKRERRPWRHFAVLYRTHRHRNELVQEFLKRGVPFSVTGLDLLDTPDVRDLMAGLQAIIGNDPVALLRVAAMPKFNVNGEELRDALVRAEEPPNLEAVLETVAGGKDVLTALAEARHEVRRMQDKALAACGIAQKHFGIMPSPHAAAFTEFIQAWGRKPQQVCGEGTLSDFLQYLDWFLEAEGSLCAPEANTDDTPAPLQMEVGQVNQEEEKEDKVRLVTAHAAKGLEFPVVFVLRVTKPWFPVKYREDLVEFPDELRDPDSRQPYPPKEAHEQEERRLFYVAVTRAEDHLVLCGKKGTGKDKTPPGYLRDVVKGGARSGFSSFSEITEQQSMLDIHAGAEATARIVEWVYMPALDQMKNRKLSASAIESYQRCPLSYKLSREWNLPEEPSANPQFGQAMHLALLAYFDSVSKARPMRHEEVVEFFLEEFGKAKITDPVQRRLYEQDGEEQLKRFLESPAAKPSGRVAMLEHRFQYDVNGTKIVGRIDRVDEDDDGYTVIDYKTGRPKSQDFADESLQLSIYALAMGEGKPVKRLVFQNLQDNTTVAAVRSAEQLRETESEIVKVAAGIAAGSFAARPGSHCSWCGYRGICPETETRLPSQVKKEEVGEAAS